VKRELKREGTPFSEDIEVGAMIEVPSAAIIDILTVPDNRLGKWVFGFESFR
ncbi:MAG: putative PEP-binding protein, partial [bacterium]